ncbi:MAG: aminoglycoside phosphotransferase family protein [Methylovirgula sp.]|jgi:aminoglycoside phosphotransferase (APT) family kinase protein
MKEHWPRHTPVVSLDAADVGRLLLPLLPGYTVASVDPVSGGLINTNLKVRLSGRPGALLLRVYQRGIAPAEKEMAVCRLLAGRVPVPRFLWFCAEGPLIGHPYAVLDWIEGFELQATSAALAADRLAALGRAIGRMLAVVHSFTFDKFGFLDAALNVTEPINLDKKGLIAYLDQTFIKGPGGARLGAELSSALMHFAAREGDMLDEWLQQPCLVHGDFNGSNILLPPGGDRTIAAIIDWEYALSATPAFDFGNLLRPPLDANPEFAAALAEGYCEAGGTLPAQWERIAQLADMYAFADILSRPATNAVVVADAKAVITKLIAS